MTFIFRTAALALVPAVALASPHPLPHTYVYGTQPRAGLELEQFVDLTPTRSASGAYELVPDLTTELEAGLTDHLELGLYVVTQGALSPSGVGMGFEGLRQRLRLRLGESGDLPVDLGLYAEVSELHDALELEGKIIADRRFGPVQVLVNLSGAREIGWSGGGETELNPTAGVVFELSPEATLGVEYLFEAEIEDDEVEAEHWIGPAFMLQQERFWWTTAPYLNPAELGEGGVPVMFRTAVGIDL